MAKNMDMIEKFLDKKLKTNNNTRKVYTYTIRNFFKTIDKDMNIYFSEKPLEDYENDIQSVYLKQEKDHKPCITRKQYFSIIKMFMNHYDKRTKDLEIWSSITGECRGAEPESDELIINRNDVKKLLNHGGTLPRAMFLMLASSGRRIGEILALYPEDVDINTTPATLKIRKTYDNSQPNKVKQSTKTKQRTICFISDEAKEAYQAWIMERDAYLRNAVKRVETNISKNGKKTNVARKDENDRRVFPMSYNNAIVLWHTLLVKSGYAKRDSSKMTLTSGTDERTNRALFHPHCLRKHFRSYLGDSDLAEFLMGHSTMMEKAYRRMTPEDLAAKYLKCMANVTFFSDIPDLSGIQEELTRKDGEIMMLKAEMQANMLIMMRKIDELEKNKK